MAAGDRGRDDRNDCRRRVYIAGEPPAVVWTFGMKTSRWFARSSVALCVGINSAPEMKRRQQPSTAAPRGYISSLVKQT
jgi:hypothetical protein